MSTPLSAQTATLGASKHPNMAWALYLTTATTSAVSDAQLAELDEFELVSRGPAEAVAAHLRDRIPQIVDALVCAAGALAGRQQMLRSVSMLHHVLARADAQLLRAAVRGLARDHVRVAGERRAAAESQEGPAFLRSLASIAVNRVSDKELSAPAAACLAILLGCQSFEEDVDEAVPRAVCEEANEQTRRLVGLLITEIVLTSSPLALSALSSLLRRDFARDAFCEKDGVSTLASTLLTQPGKGHTAIGEIIASVEGPGQLAQPISATYHAVFAVWMLSFAMSPPVQEHVLSHVLSTRLLVVLSRLLNHASGQRLKIARVTLSSMCNLASGSTELHRRIRRDLISTDVLDLLDRFLREGSGPGALRGSDEDALADAQALIDMLQDERGTMSTLDSYLAEVRADALHWSPVHKSQNFWATNAQRIVGKHRQVLQSLASVLERGDGGEASAEEVAVACNDLSYILRESVSGKAVLLSIEGLKSCLMRLMVGHSDAEVRTAALTCTQYMVMSTRRTRA